MQELFAAYEAPARELRRFAESLNLSWMESARRMAEHVRLAERHYLDWRLVKLLHRRGWFGIERHLTTDDLARLLRLRGKGRRSLAIDAFVCTAFRQNKFRRLAAMTRVWPKLSYMEKRKSIVRQALRAHKRREWALCVSALLPLVDGLAAEVRRATQRWR
jgi:hypothetical protein